MHGIIKYKFKNNPKNKQTAEIIINLGINVPLTAEIINQAEVINVIAKPIIEIINILRKTLCIKPPLYFIQHKPLLLKNIQAMKKQMQVKY